MASDYSLGPSAHSHRDVAGSDLVEAVSDPTDGPRSLQHPWLPAHQRRTAATLRFRGNLLTTTNLAATVPVDLGDLSSHDLCAFAIGPAEVRVAATGDTYTLDGTIFRQPSPRAASAEELAGVHQGS